MADGEGNRRYSFRFGDGYKRRVTGDLDTCPKGHFHSLI